MRDYEQELMEAAYDKWMDTFISISIEDFENLYPDYIFDFFQQGMTPQEAYDRLKFLDEENERYNYSS